MIKIVGVGIENGDVTEKGLRAIAGADRVFSRVKLWFDTEALGDSYTGEADFSLLDRFIAEKVAAAADSGLNVVYCALGDGFTDTAAAEIARMREVKFIPGVSEYRGRTPHSGVSFISAYDVNGDTQIDTSVPLVVYGIDDALIAGRVKLELADRYGDEQTAVFSSGKNSAAIALYELDRMKSYTGAALFIRGEDDVMEKSRYSFADLARVMTRLTADDGCPWDKAQTHESIRINLLEEAYEAADAIDKRDAENLREELGDVLLQAVFHCNIAERTGEFTFNDVVSELTAKLVTRHTHIFGENKAADADSALGFWEQAKAKEKSYNSLAGQLDRLPDSFPSLLTAAKAYKKSVKAGADLSADKIAGKLSGLLSSGVTAENAGDLLLYACFLATAAGADCEADLNKRAKSFIADMKAAEEEKSLDKADGKL